MTDVFTFSEGTMPLLISIPHDGRELMPGQAERMTETGLRLPDTDWFVRNLYAFAIALGANIIAANYSRYVVDLNRPADDASLYDNQVSTGLCPLKTFSGQSIYLGGEPIAAEDKRVRIERYWRPYHEKISQVLAAIREQHGFALLWDAHSIPSAVPLLFAGVLPDLNIGTNDGKSCGAGRESAVASVAETSPYSTVLNARFRGGFITRHYGAPGKGVHALQLELSQGCYMDENKLSYDAELAVRLGETIKEMLVAFVHTE